jgi:hypothetical protein
MAGLLTIAVFGVLLSRRFDADVKPRLDHLALPPAVRVLIDKELPKMAGADLKSLPVDRERAVVQKSLDEAFVSGYRLVVFGAAILAVAAAAFGWGVRSGSAVRKS